MRNTVGAAYKCLLREIQVSNKSISMEFGRKRNPYESSTPAYKLNSAYIPSPGLITQLLLAYLRL